LENRKICVACCATLTIDFQHQRRQLLRAVACRLVVKLERVDGHYPIKKRLGSRFFISSIDLNHGLSIQRGTPLWSFDLLVLDLTSTVVRGAFAVVGFFNFVAWFGHDILVESKLYFGMETPKREIASSVALE
jgi:hypothetical protein